MAGCPVCGGPLVNDLQRGEMVCAQCGLVVAEAAVDTGPEWKVFEKEKRVRTAPLRLVVKTDIAVKPEQDEVAYVGEVSQRHPTRLREEAGGDRRRTEAH